MEDQDGAQQWLHSTSSLPLCQPASSFRLPSTCPQEAPPTFGYQPHQVYIVLPHMEPLIAGTLHILSQTENFQKNSLASCAKGSFPGGAMVKSFSHTGNQGLALLQNCWVTLAILITSLSLSVPCCRMGTITDALPIPWGYWENLAQNVRLQTK